MLNTGDQFVDYINFLTINTQEIIFQILRKLFLE